MAKDLRCFLDAPPIRARPPNAVDGLIRWTRRHPTLAALSAVVGAVLLGAFGAITALWVNAAKARDQATAAGTEARRQSALERRTHYQAGISAAASALELDHIVLASAITATAFSPNGARIAVGSADGAVRAWQAQGGVPVAALRGQKLAIDRIVFNHTASRLLLQNDRSEVQLWNLADYRRPALGRGSDVRCSPDGKSNSCIFNREVRSLSSVDGWPVAQPDVAHQALAAVAFSPDGSRIATGHSSPRPTS